MLEKDRYVFTKIGVDILDEVIGHAHWIGPKYFRNGKSTQQVIVRLNRSKNSSSFNQTAVIGCPNWPRNYQT